MQLNYADVWETVADVARGRPAIVQGATERSWADFDLRAARLASAFTALGVGPGSTVAIDLRNSPENLEAIFAAFKCRASPFNINYRYRARELTHLFRDARPAVVVYDHSLADRVLPAIAAAGTATHPIEVFGPDEAIEGRSSFEALIGAHDPAPRIERDSDDELIIYTGRDHWFSEGVVWSHLGLMSPAMGSGHLATTAAEFQDAAVRGRARLIIPPLMHASGFMAAANGLVEGDRIVLTASPSLDPDEILGLIERHRIHTFTLIGDAIARPLLDALERAEAAGRTYDLDCIETVLNTGGILSAAVKQGLLRYGSFTINDGLGATEAGGFAAALTNAADGIETAQFRLGPNARILDEHGHDVVPGSGQEGMLATTGGRLAKRYLNDPEKTAATWQVIDGVRYAVPGDMATVEADGTIRLRGRGSEVVNTGGEKVFVEEVETVILTHPSVRDALVVGLPDERWGHRVTAVVALRAGATTTERELIDHVGAELADYKRPKRVVFAEEIPRSPTGKANRAAAKELAEQAPPPEPSTKTSNPAGR